MWFEPWAWLGVSVWHREEGERSQPREERGPGSLNGGCAKLWIRGK